MTRVELQKLIIEAEGQAQNGYDLAWRIEMIVDRYVKELIGEDEPSAIPLEHRYKGLGFSDLDRYLNARNQFRKELRERAKE